MIDKNVTDEPVTAIRVKKNAPSLEENWDNKANILNFYQKIPITYLRMCAKKAGLANGVDIEYIWEDIKNSSSIIELGAGYGRVLNALLRKKYRGKITAIENSKHFYNFLHQQYNTIDIEFSSILNFKPNKQYQTVLWLWSGISDFTKLEQEEAVKNIYNLLEDNGLLIIDTFPHDQVSTNVTVALNQEYMAIHDGAIAHGYIPSKREIMEYAEKANFSTTKVEKYKTETNIIRPLYKIYK